MEVIRQKTGGNCLPRGEEVPAPVSYTHLDEFPFQKAARADVGFFSDGRVYHHVRRIAGRLYLSLIHICFGKNYEHNLTIIHHLERLCDMGYPVLLATSRKSCIGQALDLPTDQRVEGTMVTTVMGVLKGAAFVRVHDVKENLRAIRMTQAILRDGRNG